MIPDHYWEGSPPRFIFWGKKGNAGNSGTDVLSGAHWPETGLSVDCVRRQLGQVEVEKTPAGGLAVFPPEVPGNLRKVAVEAFGDLAEERKPQRLADAFRQTFEFERVGAEEVPADLGDDLRRKPCQVHCFAPTGDWETWGRKPKVNCPTPMKDAPFRLGKVQAVASWDGRLRNSGCEQSDVNGGRFVVCGSSDATPLGLGISGAYLG